MIGQATYHHSNRTSIVILIRSYPAFATARAPAEARAQGVSAFTEGSMLPLALAVGKEPLRSPDEPLGSSPRVGSRVPAFGWRRDRLGGPRPRRIPAVRGGGGIREIEQNARSIVRRVLVADDRSGTPHLGLPAGRTRAGAVLAVAPAGHAERALQSAGLIAVSRVRSRFDRLGPGGRCATTTGPAGSGSGGTPRHSCGCFATARRRLASPGGTSDGGGAQCGGIDLSIDQGGQARLARPPEGWKPRRRSPFGSRRQAAH